MEKKRGYRIADFEQAMPAGAVIDEVRYKAKSGQLVNYVIGTVRVGDPAADADDGSMVGMRTCMVTWDNEGLCYNRRNGVRMKKWDLKLGGGV